MTEYTPLRSQPVISPAFVRKSIPHPTLTLPLTPPATPPGYDFRSTFASMQSEYPSRHGRMLDVEESPLALPTLLSDDDGDLSPGSSTGILTPPVISIMEPRITDFSGHAMLNAFSHETTPDLQQDGFERRSGFSLLSFNQPLRKKAMWPHIEREMSPPTTPKGHPLKRKQSYFGFVSKPISHPAASLSQRLTHLIRIPRRSRPAVMLLLCVFVFLGLHLSRAASAPALSKSSVLNRPGVRTIVPQIVAPRPTDLPSIAFESADEELAALISFITSTTTNVLPPLDASKPLDPAMILDFDPTSPYARDDLELIKEEIHNLFPLILFGKMRDPWHREVKKMLAEYKIVPAPLIIELDQRTDSASFVPLLARLLGTQELPQLMLRGASLGSYHDVLNLREKGEMRATLEAAGLSVTPAKKSKKRAKEAERQENERVLGPRPIIDGS